jgi:hypothetical protein
VIFSRWWKRLSRFVGRVRRTEANIPVRALSVETAMIDSMFGHAESIQAGGAGSVSNMVMLSTSPGGFLD